MEDPDHQKKSPHLQHLEDAFEKRTRRFSPFEVLGLTPEGDQKASADQSSESRPIGPILRSDEPPLIPDEHTSGSVSHSGEYTHHGGVADTPLPGGGQHTFQRVHTLPLWLQNTPRCLKNPPLLEPLTVRFLKFSPCVFQTPSWGYCSRPWDGSKQ